MFSSLRVRLFASYILLIFLSLALAAIALLFLLQGYQNKVAYARLDDMAIPLVYQIREMAQQGRTPEEMLAYVSTQADELGVRVLLLNGEGRVLRDSNRSGSLEGERLRLPFANQLGNQQQVYHGKFYGPGGRSFLYSALSGKDMLNPDRPGGGISSIVIAQPQMRIGAVLVDLFSSLLWAGGVALVAALLIGLLLTRFILRPIALFAKASQGIAKGQYDQRVPVSGPSEFKHLAETFNVMAYEVGRSRQVMRDFLANVAHEFKTPLTSIRGFAEALLDGTVGDDTGRERALKIVDSESARLQRLVAELLDLSRLEARQISMAKEPVKIYELANQCVEIFSLRAQEKQVKLEANVPQELSVLGDFDRLEQVLTNLIDNALKHVPSGGEILLDASHGSNGMVSIGVADNGPGIASDDLSRLFERFYVGDKSSSRRGVGLGLAIAREIVRSHGGDISVESVKGVGTRFLIALPAG